MNAKEPVDAIPLHIYSKMLFEKIFDHKRGRANGEIFSNKTRWLH